MQVRLVGLFLLAGWLWAALPAWGAPRPVAYDLAGKGGPLGQVSRLTVEDAGYVSAERLATVLRGTWSAKSSRGVLTVGKRSAEFTRSEPRAVIQGQAVKLDTAPRTGASGWLIPEEFLVKGLPRLVPGVTVTARAAPRRETAVKEAPKPAAAGALKVSGIEEIRYRSYPSYTRVVLETATPVTYTLTQTGEEIRMRFPRLALGAARSHDVGDGLVKGVTLEPGATETVLRVALEGRAGEVKASALRDPARVVLDVHRPRDPAVAGERAAIYPLRVIVIDPGHGGHDAGATGPSGVQEKDVVLDVSRRVARMAEEGLGVKVLMTRGNDTFVPLRERTAFANRQRADLFVSIHANAHPRAVSEGVEVYFLSSEASDRESRQVAAIENGVIQLENPGSRPKGDVLKAMLWELAQSEFQRDSSHLAETVLDSMTESLRLVPRGVKQAGFFVLGGATMPAILIEIGFLTNQKEERKLGTPAHREAVARAIYAGLADYKRRQDQRLRTAVRAEIGAVR